MNEKSKLIVSGVAIGQWKNLTRHGKTLKKQELEEKIKKAIILGKPMFMYKTGDYIIRYYDINILVSSSGIVLTVWKHVDNSTYVFVDEKSKDNLKDGLLNIDDMAYARHEIIKKGEYKMKSQGVGF